MLTIPGTPVISTGLGNDYTVDTQHTRYAALSGTTRPGKGIRQGQSHLPEGSCKRSGDTESIIACIGELYTLGCPARKSTFTAATFRGELTRNPDSAASTYPGAGVHSSDLVDFLYLTLIMI